MNLVPKQKIVKLTKQKGNKTIWKDFFEWFYCQIQFFQLYVLV